MKIPSPGDVFPIRVPSYKELLEQQANRHYPLFIRKLDDFLTRYTKWSLFLAMVLTVLVFETFGAVVGIIWRII